MKESRNAFCLLLAFLFGGGCAAPAPFQGKLDRLRKETRKKRGSRGRGERRGGGRYRESWGDEEEEGDPFEELELEILKYTLLLPFTLPVVAADDPGLREKGYFLSRPYAGDAEGAMSFLPPENGGKGKGWKVDAGLENGNDFHGLNRTGLTFLADGSARIGFMGRLDAYREEGAEDLFLGVGDLTLRFAQCETFQFRVGLGARFWADENGGRGGLDFVYAADFQPGKPMLFSLEFHAGTLGGAWVTEERGVLGAQVGPFRVQGGYQHLKVGGVDLDGPFLGAGFSF